MVFDRLVLEGTDRPLQNSVREYLAARWSYFNFLFRLLIVFVWSALNSDIPLCYFIIGVPHCPRPLFLVYNILFLQR
jgi:hypothetical protein